MTKRIDHCSKFEVVRCSTKWRQTNAAIRTLVMANNQNTAVVQTGCVMNATTSKSGFGFIEYPSLSRVPLDA